MKGGSLELFPHGWAAINLRVPNGVLIRTLYMGLETQVGSSILTILLGFRESI